MDAPDTRTRLVTATAALLQRQGYEATSVKRIIAEAGATYGSLYHFFPNGKEELAAEALRFGAEEFADLLRRGLSSSRDPATAIAQCATLLADDLRGSDWSDGCPVAATALEIIGRSPSIQQAADDSLRLWRQLIANKLREGGFTTAVADDLACTTVSILEGAELIARVSSDDEPLRAASRHLKILIESIR
ncbi:TetR/AcrR family transcriptional regulator [Mycobacterium sp. CBMA271]|uniref:TetR/AcrR family transcriptional regulator n=1 Tax=unclassified Mycobacteroides TaxID=2618759 RepID=UPI001329FC5F|nr:MULTISPECIES: TetR/AcrR family transcriptional regulator [unclassified Mycobacteroides]MUM16781.1 TetR family transcriptional regulator [Mycobacteroides sp. CBMA 326]MUM20254.1 TetR/AcrR family transcriptional regulator [Mycobacteroides sp. CBMA 271]